MRSFTMLAIGRLTKEPETGGEGDRTYTNFTLIANDFNGTGKEESITTIRFVAFGALGESIAKHCRKGDQLIVHAQVKSNNWIDDQDRRHYDYSFTALDFSFGAPGKIKREELAQRQQQGGGTKQAPSDFDDDIPF